MRNNKLIQCIAFQLLITSLLVAFQPSAIAAENTPIRMGINHGLSEPLKSYDRQERYQTFSDYISEVLKRPVRFEVFQNLKRPTGDPKKARYDIAFVRPSNNVGLALRDKGSSLVASAKGDLNAYFFVSKDSPIKTPAEMKGKRFVMPAPTSLMSYIGLASLRDLGIDPTSQQISYTDFQEQGGFMVQQKLTDVSIVGPLVAKDMQAKGNVLIYKSKPVPSWAMVASPSISQVDVEKLRAALINLSNTEAGKKILHKIEVDAFEEGNKDQYIEMLKWLKI
ncbi:ABC-type phosphate/phosphonate transport system substrate-binding protein [Sulfurirhabdus autotrophica]|uniref:ABC-type phosphate/phosphonate transport system substrate-binding protein n=2 Tax=Sulfurirhabdus autotrophica TaxID=1706046 RepID=A0A4R3YAY8_9PROT|nr:ABC-type phosphate/phosphonate transport system substrate-binding protein [Sulfurirhabdus autotrophica]